MCAEQRSFCVCVCDAHNYATTITISIKRDPGDIEQMYYLYFALIATAHGERTMEIPIWTLFKKYTDQQYIRFGSTIL